MYSTAIENGTKPLFNLFKEGNSTYSCNGNLYNQPACIEARVSP